MALLTVACCYCCAQSDTKTGAEEEEEEEEGGGRDDDGKIEEGEGERGEVEGGRGAESMGKFMMGDFVSLGSPSCPMMCRETEMHVVELPLRVTGGGVAHFDALCQRPLPRMPTFSSDTSGDMTETVLSAATDTALVPS